MLLERIAEENTAIRSRCNYCDNPASSFCGRCRATRYCSAACQKRDHYYHKQLCSTFKENYTLDKRPSRNHVRAILFAAEKVKPTFVWVHQLPFSDGGPIFLAQEKVLLGDYDTGHRGITELHHAIPNVGHGLLILSRRLVFSSNAPLNQCVMQLGKAGHMKTWFGNQLLIGLKRQTRGSLGPDIAQYDDIDFRDFRHALDYYQQHPANPCIVDSYRDPRPFVPGVVLYCEAAQKRFKKFGLEVPAEQVLIPMNQPMVLEEAVCMRTLSLGLEWGYRRYRPQTEWSEEEINNANMRNELAMPFVQCLIDGNALIPLLYPGTVVLFDNRGAKIQPLHLVAIAEFLDSVVAKPARIQSFTQAFAKQCDTDFEDRGKETKQGLEEFWVEWQKDDNLPGVDKSAIVAPTQLQPTLDMDLIEGEFLKDLQERLAVCEL